MELTTTQVLLRRLAVLMIVVGFCMLPGPRGLLADLGGFLFEEDTLASFAAGLHLSLVHFCWLFGLEMPTWEYPENVDSQLAAIALIISLAVQIAIVMFLIYVWRGTMHWYYTRKALMEERAEFGDFEA
jgi:hypothetical protein